MPPGVWSLRVCLSFGMPCYDIPCTTSRGTLTISKWGNTPEEAESLAKKSASPGAVIGKAKLVVPQPFSEESRALRACRHEQTLRAA